VLGLNKEQIELFPFWQTLWVRHGQKINKSQVMATRREVLKKWKYENLPIFILSLGKTLTLFEIADDEVARKSLTAGDLRLAKFNYTKIVQFSSQALGKNSDAV